MISEHKLKLSKCLHCGGNLKYDFNNNSVICDSCGVEVNKEEIGLVQSFTLVEDDLKNLFEYDFKSINCKSCGAHLDFNKDSIVNSCPYCNSTNIVEIVDTKKYKKPDGMIPFSIDKKKSKELLKDWLKLHKVAPRKFVKSINSSNPVGVFIPYWFFSTDVSVTYLIEQYENKQSFLKEKKYTNTFNNIFVSGSKNYDKEISNTINDYDFDKIIAYNPNFFNSFLAEKSNIDIEYAWKEAMIKMEKTILDDIRIAIPPLGDYTIYEKNNTYDTILFNQYFLPIWFIKLKYKKSNYTLIVNGQTGKIYGNCPSAYSLIALRILIPTTIFLLLHYLFNFIF